MKAMKSPYTGKEMTRIYEPRTWRFRGEEYPYIHTAWLSEDSGEQFTDDESDTAGFVQVTNQYREKYGIPYTDEIIATRKRYGISAQKMSLILGIGVNQYRLYEQGEVPNVSNGRMIRSVNNPKVMLDLLDSSRNEMADSEYQKIFDKIQCEIARRERRKIEDYETARVYRSARGAGNGYAPLSLDRLKNAMLHLLENSKDVWCTKMNKLLFYIDFLAYRETGMAITGLSYKAIDFGPVPGRWNVVYSEFADIHQELQSVGDFVGSVLTSTSKADMSLFSDVEKKVIESVCERFKDASSRDLSRMSHKETAWIRHHADHEDIPFSEAFELKAV